MVLPLSLIQNKARTVSEPRRPRFAKQLYFLTGFIICPAVNEAPGLLLASSETAPPFPSSPFKIWNSAADPSLPTTMSPLSAPECATNIPGRSNGSSRTELPITS
ncbi:hypothetical protein Dimus_037372 [Dionaea muscipula]